MRLTTSITFSILAASLMAGCGAPQVDIAAEVEAVRARGEGLMAAISAQNVEETLTFFTDDVIWQLPGAPQIEGKEAFGDVYRQWFENLKEASEPRKHIEVSASGDLAYEYGVNRVILTGPEGDLLDMGKYLDVWKKIDGEWYIAAGSSTSDAPEPVPLVEE